MSDAQNFGFAKMVPGFDFLQNLAKGASEAMPQMPGFSNWIAPTLSVEEVDKRISELRAVQFWLEQNNRALAATVQALEVQKMTLVTLEGMNVTMSDLAEALKVQPVASAAPDKSPAEKQEQAAPEAQPAGSSASARGEESRAKARAAQDKAKAPAGATAGGVIDPLQWWTSLTRQFQQIATSALQEAAQQAPMDFAANALSAAGAKKADTSARSGAASTGGTASKGATAGKPASKTASRPGAGKPSGARKPAAKTPGRGAPPAGGAA